MSDNLDPMVYVVWIIISYNQIMSCNIIYVG